MTNKVIPRPRKPLKPIDVQPVLFHMVGSDIAGSLKATKLGNRYILSVIDYYTTYAEAEALPNQQAKTIVKLLRTCQSKTVGCYSAIQSLPLFHCHNCS